MRRAIDGAVAAERTPDHGRSGWGITNFFNDTATTEIYTLSLHVALPIWLAVHRDEIIGGQHGLTIGFTQGTLPHDDDARFLGGGRVVQQLGQCRAVGAGVGVIEGQIDSLPAGADAIAVLGVVFLVLLVLEVTGVINIFK